MVVLTGNIKALMMKKVAIRAAKLKPLNWNFGLIASIVKNVKIKIRRGPPLEPTINEKISHSKISRPTCNVWALVSFK